MFLKGSNNGKKNSFLKLDCYCELVFYEFVVFLYIWVLGDNEFWNCIFRYICRDIQFWKGGDREFF